MAASAPLFLGRFEIASSFTIDFLRSELTRLVAPRITLVVRSMSMGNLGTGSGGAGSQENSISVWITTAAGLWENLSVRSGPSKLINRTDYQAMATDTGVLVARFLGYPATITLDFRILEGKTGQVMVENESYSQ
ncbi:hypothetical protein OIU79_023045 [Salix purpurea]|uniref:Uncharacterized protein n=1 Tax=Salix purpurea TaxID=77065 RepID=A0A9Q1ADH7_SALPP|nr:hypothetical protein OIU79_023045 [Salix purpurea]